MFSPMISNELVVQLFFLLLKLDHFNIFKLVDLYLGVYGSSIK